MRCKAMAKWTSKVDESFGLAFRLATYLRGLESTCEDLRGLALTLVELKF